MTCSLLRSPSPSYNGGVFYERSRPGPSGKTRKENHMTQYWVFTQGGAWRNPNPAGSPYVCEQCRLDARSGNDSTLTLQAVTTIELAPTDVCGDCGARLLEEAEARDRA